MVGQKSSGEQSEKGRAKAGEQATEKARPRGRKASEETGARGRERHGVFARTYETRRNSPRSRTDGSLRRAEVIRIKCKTENKKATERKVRRFFIRKRFFVTLRSTQNDGGRQSCFSSWSAVWAVGQAERLPQPLQPSQPQPQPVLPFFLRQSVSPITPATTSAATTIIIISIGFISFSLSQRLPAPVLCSTQGRRVEL